MIFKLLNLLFTTNTYNNYIVPEKNKYILSLASIWILPLIYKTYITNHLILSVILTNLCIVSPLFWYNYNHNSLLHKIDKYLAISCYIYLFIIFHNPIFFIINSLGLFSLFIYSEYCCIHNLQNMQVISHLTFRLFYFRLVYNLTDKSTDIIYIIPYILHNYYLINKKKINYCKDFIYLYLIINIINLLEI